MFIRNKAYDEARAEQFLSAVISTSYDTVKLLVIWSHTQEQEKRETES